VVICLERDADLHMAQLMPLSLTVCCFSKIQIGFTFLVPAHPGSPGQRDVKRVCVCVYEYDCLLNEPKVAYRSKLSSICLPICLDISYSIAVGLRAPPSLHNSWGGRTSLLLPQA